MRKIKALIFVVLINTPLTALADCGALQPLVMIHDGYRAMISNDRRINRSGADLMHRLVPIYNAKAFTTVLGRMSLNVDSVRLDLVLADGFSLARDVTQNRQIFGETLENHEKNADWLTNILVRTGCFREQPNTSSAPRETTATNGTFEKTDQSTAPKAKSKKPIDFDWRILLVLVAVALAIGGGYKFYRSIPMRKQRVERQPREQLAMVCEAKHNGESTRVIFLDISLGGAKVEWRAPPEQGSQITATTPLGEISAIIVWANAFYAGLLFDRQLTQDEVSFLVKENGTRTRSRLPAYV